MYAIIESGGKQYRVQEGDIITVEKLAAEVGDQIEIDRVLLISDENEVKVGSPYVEGAKVIAEVLETGKGKKIIVFKFKSKKDYRKKQGHRQPYTMLKIESLTGKISKKEKKPAKEESKAEDVNETVETADIASETVEKKVSASMKKDELIAYAEEKGIEIDTKATKAEILEKIEAAEK